MNSLRPTRIRFPLVSLGLMVISLFLTGCFEAKSEIEIRIDGSGRVRGELVLSERMVIGMESANASEGGMTMNPKNIMDEASLRKQIGDTAEVISLVVEDLPDGSRRIRYELEVDDMISYLNEQSDNQLHDVRMVRLDEETGGLEFGTGVDSGSMDIEFDQMYGLMKGLYAETKVTLPVKITSEFLEVDPEGRSVTWKFDLRNKEGLDRIKQLDQTLDGKSPQVRFALADFKINAASLPLVSNDSSTGVVQSTVENDGGVRAEVAVLKSTHHQQLISDEKMEKIRFSNLGKEEMEVYVMLTWDDDSRPANYLTVVLEQVVTDNGEDLMKEGQSFSFTRDVSEREDAVFASAKVNMPSSAAKSILLLKGHVPVVAGVELETIQIEHPGTKVGEGKLENEPLQSIGVYLKEVKGTEVQVVTEGQALEEIALIKSDGRRVTSQSSGRSGMNNTNTYSFTFPETVEAEDLLELTVRISEEHIEVPFEMRDIPLP